MFGSFWSPDHKTWEGESCTNNDIVKVETAGQSEKRPTLPGCHHSKMKSFDWSLKPGSTWRYKAKYISFISSFHPLCTHAFISMYTFQAGRFSSVLLLAVRSLCPYIFLLMSWIVLALIFHLFYFPLFLFDSEVSEILRVLLILSKVMLENGLTQDRESKSKSTLYLIHFCSLYIERNAVCTLLKIAQ